MSPITIDETKCKRDGDCVADCPVGLFRQKPDQIPTTVSAAEKICINCGHCVAICAQGAITHRSVRPEQCPPVRPEWALDEQRAEYFLRSRRSIRRFHDRPVEKEKLQRLIEIGRNAPNAHNYEPVRWVVFSGRETMKKLAALTVDWIRWVAVHNPGRVHQPELIVKACERGNDLMLRDTHHMILAYAHKDDLTAMRSCTLALGYLELAAPAMGLGTCWAGFLQVAAEDFEPLQKYLALPEDHLTYGALVVGYPKPAYHRLPNRKTPDITWR